MLDITPGRRQSKTLLTIDGRGSKIDRNSVFGRQMAIGNSISNDFLSTFIDGIDVFDCRLPCVDIAIIYCINSEYVAFLRLIKALREMDVVSVIETPCNKNYSFMATREWSRKT